MAARRCYDTLGRLARGEGGFYDVDDFWQDLFVEFWALAQRPELAAATWEDEALRTAWGKALWGGGLRILRRAPQRLWRRFAARLELPVDPARLDGELAADAWAGDRGAEPFNDAPLAGANLVGDDGPAAHEALARVAALEAGLARLSPAQRQALYLVAVEGLPASLVAARLGLSSANAVSQRVAAARQRLTAEASDRWLRSNSAWRRCWPPWPPSTPACWRCWPAGAACAGPSGSWRSAA